MKRLALLFAGGALWLLLAAVPVLADGGPHVASINSGVGGISADSCAGCHRAHTAQTDSLLQAATEEGLCLSCHGSTATGATTNVENGVQYALASASSGTVRDTSVILGALRGGGFVTSAIGSDSTVRVAYLSGSAVRENAKVPVKVDAGGAITGQPVTSTHFDLGNPDFVGMAWGNGPVSATPDPGGDTELTCTSCHNPHGNNQYRILNPIPGVGSGTAVAATTDVDVTDAPLPQAGDTRNYTVIQLKGTEGAPSTYLLYASQVVAGSYSNVAGDYLHRKLPWNGVNGTANDAPNGLPSTFDTQITAWCTQCHTRYASDGASIDSGDAIFTHRHYTAGKGMACTTCHVAHGSNAQMTGIYSANMAYPGGAAAPVGDSRLLKIDNRGTCQACHDPTETITVGTQVGPTPNPILP